MTTLAQVKFGGHPMELGPDPYHVWVTESLFFAALVCLLVACGWFVLARISRRKDGRKVPMPLSFRYILGSGVGLLLTGIIFLLLISVFDAPGG